jgi:ABC-type oligopeptide transport system ATPase subunit
MIKINIEEINRKNKLIDAAIVSLKGKYIGIDEQIDEIMNNVRTWFCYPELQDRPLVVNLWGMSGCGKTDCVKSIAELLDIESDLVYFNFADINEKSAWEVQQDIEDNVGNSKSNRMFVYDEFQYAATIGKDGKEKDNKCGLKPFWELLDTGILKTHPEIKWLSILIRAYYVMNEIYSISNEIIDFTDCKWSNFKNTMESLDSYKQARINEIFEKVEVDDKGTEVMEIRDYIKERLYDVHKALHGVTYDMNNVGIESRLSSMNFVDTMNLFYDTFKEATKGYELNFKNSIIFVIGNLDEAYEVSFNVNPDMSPDQFHKITKKISIVDVKEALEQRFRNEQIARLGNIHVIYPSFSKNTFKKIIALQLNKYAEQVKEQIGCDIEFNDSINKIIYKEGVFPTHGTRPVFSSIQEIVKTRLPEIIREIEESGNIEKLNKLYYSYKNGTIKVNAFDEEGNDIGNSKYKLKLRVENLREATCDEFQALCAVHESGHFCVYMNVFGSYPEKVVSKAAEADTGGFLQQNIDDDNEAMKTYSYYFNQIKVALGGYVAEEFVFGKDNRTSGALSDLQKATSIASKMVRSYGMVSPYVSDLLIDVNSRNYVVEDNRENENDQIKSIILKAKGEVEKLFYNHKYRKMLKLSSEYLSKHTSMPKNKMEEIYSVIPENERTVKKDRFYRDAIESF